ncbi:MAG: response regulator transcription factor [Rubrivivax sp.]|nr:response regulator transcription factor [Rubrivivax sp.]
MTRVYILEDHAIVREGLRAVLEVSGMQVIGEADNIGQGLAEIVARVPDVVLLDLGLPDRSGLDLLAQLAAQDLPTRVLVLTVSERPWHIAEATRLGAAGYVLKGSTAEEIVKAIGTVVQGRRHFSGSVAARAAEAASGQVVDPIAVLSIRERQIMRMVVAGMSSAAIGAELSLSPKTVDTYRSRLMSKLGVHDLANLVRVAVRLGVIDGDQG